ncbi:uncharacterized protein LOC106667213 isoform X2 [Cimex lectularius]|uniref:Uncharacterized protein n=1 Tax=Cimex lectularius TaxID=79782 RepID=A0A8I6RSF4_CIMLE|nr:uncharacterized protein LOC106667213 isoform X2 [Cimex lectularius]
MNTTLGYWDISDLHKRSTVELANLIADRKLKKRLVALVDFEFSERLNEKTPKKELLSVLHSLASNYKQFDLVFLKKAIPHLERHIKEGNFSIYEQIQCMYYISKYGSKPLGKRISSLVLEKVTKKQLDILNENDLAIFCLSSFSSGVNLADTGIPSFIVKQISKDLTDTTQDSLFIFRLICFIKCLRQAEHYDDNLFTLLARKLINGECNLRNLPVTTMVHLLQYYCNGLYADVDFILWAVRESVQQVESSFKTRKRVRLKDLNNLLYSASRYCCKEINEVFQNSSIPNHVYYTFKENKVPPNMMANILLSLWIAECDVKDAVVEFITENNINLIKGNDNFKDFAKLNLFLTCIRFESPNLLGFDVKNAQSYHLQPRREKYLLKRPHLKKMLEFLAKNGHIYGLTDIRFAFQVPGLYIGGIRANHLSGNLDIEVIDSTVCLRKSKQPNGNMVLKLRLLKKMNHNFISLYLNNADCFDQNLESVEHQLKTALL